MSMSSVDIEKLAEVLSPKLSEALKSNQKDFWVNAEKHYNDHKDWDELRETINGEGMYDLKNLLKLYRTTKSLWFRAFIGLAVLGSIVLAGVGLGVE